MLFFDLNLLKKKLKCCQSFYVYRDNAGSKSLNASKVASCHRLAPEGSISSYSRDNVSLRRGLFKKKEKVFNFLLIYFYFVYSTFLVFRLIIC